MYTFLVLGLIPGTNIQINFYAWIVIMLGLAAAIYKFRVRIARVLHELWRELEGAEPRRPQPLHASRLHLRGQ